MIIPIAIIIITIVILNQIVVNMGLKSKQND